MPKSGNIRNYAAEIIDLINEAYNVYAKSNEVMSRYDNELTDLTHALELFKMNAVDLVKHGSDIKRNRVERRQHKDETERLHALIKWLQNNDAAISDLKGVRTNTNKTINMQRERYYTPRVRKDLTKRFREEESKK